MSEITKKDLVEALHEVMDSHKDISSGTHNLHHQFIEMMMKKEERRAKRWETIKTQTIGWGIIAALAGVGTWVATHLGITTK